MTQQDYSERADRIDAGTATDEDRRLVEMYERAGFARDGEEAVAQITGIAEAEVVRGDATKPRKTTPRGRTR